MVACRRWGSWGVVVALAMPTGAVAQSGRIPIALPGQHHPEATPFELAIARGDQALDRGEYPAARQQFETAARLDPHDARPAFYLGEVALRQSAWSEAEPHFREAIRLNPRMAEAHADLGTVLREEGHSADAVPELEAALRIDNTLAEAHLSLGIALEDAGQRDRALTEYRSAVRLAPDDPMPALNLGVLLAAGSPARGSQPQAEAFRMLQSAVRNANNDRGILLNAGPALRAIGEPALAADALERARVQGPPTAALLAELAQALWARGDHPIALQRIGEAIALDGRRAELHYVRGLMLAEQHDAAAGLIEMQRVSQLAPGTPLAERAQAHARALRERAASHHP